jgi:hypothetical protein
MLSIAQYHPLARIQIFHSTVQTGPHTKRPLVTKYLAILFPVAKFMDPLRES